jgi:hypothetical protein
MHHLFLRNSLKHDNAATGWNFLMHAYCNTRFIGCKKGAFSDKSPPHRIAPIYRTPTALREIFVMSAALKLFDELIALAKPHALAGHRSVPKQIERCRYKRRCKFRRRQRS